MTLSIWPLNKKKKTIKIKRVIFLKLQGLCTFCILYFSDMILAYTEQQDGGVRARDGEGRKHRWATQVFQRPDGVRDGGAESRHGARRVPYERSYHHTDYPGETSTNKYNAAVGEHTALEAMPPDVFKCLFLQGRKYKAGDSLRKC